MRKAAEKPDVEKVVEETLKRWGWGPQKMHRSRLSDRQMLTMIRSYLRRNVSELLPPTSVILDEWPFCDALLKIGHELELRLGERDNCS